MPPSIFLILVLLLTAWAFTLAEMQRRRRHAAIRTLAREWEMLFSPHDTLDLTGRVAGLLPTPGASEVVLHDLVYGSGPAGHAYFLSAVYTVGVLGSKSRVRRVARVDETLPSQDRPSVVTLTLAPTDLPWLEQYEALKRATV